MYDGDLDGGRILGSLPPQNRACGKDVGFDRLVAHCVIRARQDPLAVRLSKRVFHLPREAHPHVDEIAQAILFESEAKFERMQAFLDRKKK